MAYVIESKSCWVDKEGNSRCSISYFKEHNCVVLPMNFMLGHKTEAKLYQHRVDALIDFRKYFMGRKGAKIVNV